MSEAVLLVLAGTASAGVGYMLLEPTTRMVRWMLKREMFK